MFDTIKRVLKDCTTENDGSSYCPFRVTGLALAGGGIPTFIGAGIWAAYQGHFDFVAFGTGFAAMLGGLGVLAGGIALKAKTDT
ncbi:hypothetical protein [Paraburkholderia phenoliruptrix]|uniref:hypothetical protein n=1 Tax=Paraburkholderia phenoliruptrix TaxID=252970 RepID=UPI0034CDA959